MMREQIISIRWLCLLFSTLGVCSQPQGQCSFDFGTAIPDTQSITVLVEVTGLVNDDLTGGQSLCAINIAFRHSYLGDLTIELVSPAGQIVQLVGPVNDQISPTNLTTWNVQFLQCGFPASPDPGFMTTWDNNQAWQILSNYSGSYYPSSGCLEDFNSGSANGTWRVIITDHDAPQTGELISVELVFCDNTGIDCTLCESEAGGFMDVSETLCEGVALPDSFFSPVYPVDTPDILIYDYSYLLSNNGINHFMLNQINTETLPVGMYTVCGLSFDRMQTGALSQHLDTLTLSELQDAFELGEIPYCADLTESCITLEILDLPDTSFINATLCPGETLVIGNQNLSTAGIHIVEIPVAGACDSVVVVDLNVTAITGRIIQVDTVSCEDEITQLDATSSAAGPGAAFTWSTLTGMILGPDDQPVITIQGSGTFTLTITEGACVDIVEWEVVTDNSFPFVAIEDGLIDCNNPTFRFEPVTFPFQVSYSWSGPNAFASTMENPVVSAGGTYILNVTDITGCSATTTAVVQVDTTHEAVSFLEVKDCEAGEVLLCLLPPASINDYFWTGPGGFVSTSRTIFVSDPGMYAGTITYPNGCTSEDSIFIAGDFSIPDVSLIASDDTLNCTEQIDLSAVSGTGGLSYTWSGPGGFSSSDSSIVVSVTGQYIVQSTAANECIDSDTINIERGDDLFDVTIFPDTIDCVTDTVIIGVLPNAIVSSYTWSGNGLQDSVPFVEVSLPGVYQVEIVDTAQCVLTVSVEVFNDDTPIDFIPVHDTISCSAPSGQLSFIPNGPVSSMQWLYPDQSTSSDSVLITNIPGVYRLTITGENGCPRTRSVELVIDTLAPVVFVSGGEIGCAGSAEISSITIDSTVSYNWTGPMGFTATTPEIVVSETGLYTLTVVATNGCSTVVEETVIEDIIPPQIMIDSLMIDCGDSTTFISVMADDPTAQIWWYNGNILIDSAIAISPSEPGQYIVVVTGSNGCSSADTVDFPGFTVPQFTGSGGTLTCAMDTVVLNASASQQNVMFEWYDSGGALGSGTSLPVGVPGLYGLRAIVENGCPGDLEVEVLIDTLAPLAVITAPVQNICGATQIVTIDGSASVGNSLGYAWSTSDGVIMSGTEAPEASVQGLGTYHLVVMDGVNGCVGVDSIMLQPASNLSAIQMTIVPECSGNQLGSIAIDSVPGATGTSVITLDGSPPDAPGIFGGLPAGTYLVSVVDSAGCTLDTAVIVGETVAGSLVDLGDDIEAVVGDIVALTATLFTDSSNIGSVQWTPALPCNSCLENMIIPAETTTFQIAVTDTFGCLATDEIVVYVEERAKFFIPNIFSPNGDGINDALTLAFHPGVAVIHAYRVFDRWGNQVFGAENVSPQDPALIWDGTHAGEPLNPGVFAYLLDVELITGRRQIFSGDVTLIR